VTTATNFKTIELFGGGGGGGDLDTTLGLGDFTGANNIVFSVLSGAQLDAEDNVAGAGSEMLFEGSSGGGGVFPGGDLRFLPGAGAGGANDGNIVLDGDVIVNGSLTLDHLREGIGSPEGSEVANISTIYCRTDGGAGNSLYVKQANNGAATGWAPIGPLFVEEFTSVGVAAFVTTRAVFDDPVSLGVDNLVVFWNGVLQREGGTEDYTVVFGGASATITFLVTPPATDLVTIKYLPE
jgi:hypothetical protein